MKLTNFTFKRLIKGEKLTFLVGAGCSVDTPSCLPSGRKMMDVIIKYVCAESEIEKILNLKELRFEQLMQIIQDRLDPELRIIEFYGESDKPNLLHFFLAEMIIEGHFVLTTNFDFLIEFALLQSNVKNNDVIPVITKDDFKKYENPNKIFKNRKKLVYKIHGSIRNIITGEDTRDSLVATIRALGSNKEGLNIFQIEPFKRNLFDNVSNKRTLVVLGYSGSDDFDVVPTLMVLKNLKKVIWINFISNDGGKERIFEINDDIFQETKELDKVDQILTDIYKKHNVNHIYRVDANTTRLIKNLMDTKPKVSPDKFSVSITSWLKNNITISDEMMKYYISAKIYYIFDKYKESLRCIEKILQIAQELGDESWKAIAFNNSGLIYRNRGEYEEALKRYKYSLKINKKMNNLSGMVAGLINTGEIFIKKAKIQKALEKFEKAVKISRELGNLFDIVKCLNHIGMIYSEQGKFLKALKKYEDALRINEQLGNLYGKAVSLNNIGDLLRKQGKYQDALKNYEKALKIAKQLEKLTGIATYLSNIAFIYLVQENYLKALNLSKKALKIFKHLGDIENIANLYINISEIHSRQKNYSKSLILLEKALKIFTQLEDWVSVALIHNNISGIYKKQGNTLKALRQMEEAYQLLNHIGLSESPYALIFKDNIEYLKKAENIF